MNVGPLLLIQAVIRGLSVPPHRKTGAIKES